MVHYIDKPALLLYATTYVLQLVVIHTSEAEQDALFVNSARVGGLKIGGHWSVYSCHRIFEITNKFCYLCLWLLTFRSLLDQKSLCRCLFATSFLHIISLPCHFPFASLCTLHYVDWLNYRLHWLHTVAMHIQTSTIEEKRRRLTLSSSRLTGYAIEFRWVILMYKYYHLNQTILYSFVLVCWTLLVCYNNRSGKGKNQRNMWSTVQ